MSNQGFCIAARAAAAVAPRPGGEPTAPGNITCTASEGMIYTAAGPAGQLDEIHGSLNVPIEHHPTIKVMSNIPKMGHLMTHEILLKWHLLRLERRFGGAE